MARIATLGSDDSPPSTPIHVDILPAWAPDGRSIAFSRSSFVEGESTGNEIVTVDLASGEAETLVQVTAGTPGAVYFGLIWAPNGERLYYSVAHPDPDEPQNGVWAYDLATDEVAQLVLSDPDKGPPALTQVAETGQTGLVIYPSLATQAATAGDYFALLDLESNALAPVDPAISEPPTHDIVRVVTFSPDGTLALFGMQRLDDDLSSLQVRSLPDGLASVVVETDTAPIMTTIGRGLFWANDGTVFAATMPSGGLLLHLDPGGDPRTSPVPTTDSSDRTAPADDY
jgi:hypothetical protein